MIRSMTAFAREEQQLDEGGFTWEIKSVNHRYLEISFRLPEIFRELEPLLKAKMTQHLSRGKVDCTLRFLPGIADNSEFKVNDTLIAKLCETSQKLAHVFKQEALQLSLTDLLRWPGVLQVQEGDKSELGNIVITLFEQLLEKVNIAREQEGGNLVIFLKERLDRILEIIQRVYLQIEEIYKLQRERILNRFKELQLEVDTTRLEQEMVFLMQKTDVAEELDRLKTHVGEVHRILEEGDACGRRLDFMMQELNREANTLGSKSIHEKTTQASVELKVLVEQMREQVQNIE